MPAKDLILERFSSLTPQLQTAARFVADHPNEVVTLSMRTLADRADVKPATLVRLAQQLGYDGWPELKSAFTTDMGLNTERYGQRARTLTKRGPDAGMLGELFAVQRDNISRTEAFGAAPLREAVKLMKRARAVHVVGFRATSAIAASFVYGYRLFRNSVYLIDGQSGGMEMQLRPVERQDVLVVISFSPYSREPLMSAKMAKAAGAHIIALTDSITSPVALESDLTILYSVDSPSFLPSMVAPLALVEGLLELLVADGGDTVAKRIDQAEQQLFDSGAYLQPPNRRSTSKK